MDALEKLSDAGALPPLPGAARLRGLRIGLLGGSFNPAHEGHLHISLEALKRLDLDRVWWLVSPQNPLKSRVGMAPLEERLTHARRLARHPRILVTGLERRLGTVYTADTLARLREVAPGVRFVWLMGADSLLDLPRWHRWHDIPAGVPLVIFDRERYARRCLAGAFGSRYRHDRVSVGARKSIATSTTPAWTFIALRRHPQSATAVRARPTLLSAGSHAASSMKE